MCPRCTLCSSEGLSQRVQRCFSREQTHCDSGCNRRNQFFCKSIDHCGKDDTFHNCHVVCSHISHSYTYRTRTFGILFALLPLGIGRWRSFYTKESGARRLRCISRVRRVHSLCCHVSSDTCHPDRARTLLLPQFVRTSPAGTNSSL